MPKSLSGMDKKKKPTISSDEVLPKVLSAKANFTDKEDIFS